MSIRALIDYGQGKCMEVHWEDWSSIPRIELQSSLRSKIQDVRETFLWSLESWILDLGEDWSSFNPRSGLNFNPRDASGLLPKHMRKHALYLTSVILFWYCTRTRVQSVHIYTYRVVVQTGRQVRGSAEFTPKLVDTRGVPYIYIYGSFFPFWGRWNRTWSSWRSWQFTLSFCAVFLLSAELLAGLRLFSWGPLLSLVVWSLLQLLLGASRARMRPRRV